MKLKLELYKHKNLIFGCVLEQSDELREIEDIYSYEDEYKRGCITKFNITWNEKFS